MPDREKYICVCIPSYLLLCLCVFRNSESFICAHAIYNQKDFTAGNCGVFSALLVLSEKCQVTSIFHDQLLSNCARSIAPQSPQPISPKLSIFILVPGSNSEESEINEAAQNALDEYQFQGNPSNQLHAVDLANQI